MQHDEGDKRRSSGGPKADPCEDDPVSRATFIAWNPAGDKLIGRGKHHSLAYTKKKTNHGEDQQGVGDVMRDGGRERAEDAPQHKFKSKHSPWTESIGEPSRGGLEDCVAKKKYTKYQSEADVADGKFLSEFCSCNRQIHPVDESDRAEDKEPNDKEPADAACRLCIHFASVTAINPFRSSSRLSRSMRFKEPHELLGDDFFFARFQHERVHAEATFK